MWRNLRTCRDRGIRDRYTIADFENPEALAPIAIDEPTMSMQFTINDSPFFGRDGNT